MRWTIAALLCAVKLFAPAHALTEDEAGVVDWHKELIGVPLTHWDRTAPTFHRSQDESVIITATGSNVLAAINPNNGSIAWRYMFAGPLDQITSFYREKDTVAALSGPGGATLRVFDALKGHLLIEERLHAPDMGRLSEPTTGISVAFVPSSGAQSRSDILVLSNGHELRKLNGETGELMWKGSSADESSMVIYEKIVPTNSAIYLVGLAKSFASFTIHISALSPQNGETIGTTHVSSSLEEGTSNLVIITPANSDVPSLVWLEKGVIKSIPLTQDLKNKPVSMKGAFSKIMDIGLGSYSQFIGVKADGTARLIKPNKEGSGFIAFWEFDTSVSMDAVGVTYAGGVDQDNLPYVARIAWLESSKQASIEVYGAHLADGQGVSTTYKFPFDTVKFGVMAHAAFDIIPGDEKAPGVRLLLTTTTGSLQLWRTGDTVPWTREESLAYISQSEFVDLPERQVEQAHGLDAHDETFVGRLLRHALDAQNLPNYLRNFATRFATGSYASPSSTSGVSGLYRDTFGFRKIILVVSAYGKVFAIDTRDGSIVWARVLGLGSSEPGTQMLPAKMFVMQTAAEGTPQAILISLLRSPSGLFNTVVYHFDALTGSDVTGNSPPGSVLQGTDILPAPLVEAYLLDIGNARVAVLIDEYQQVHLYPDTEHTQKEFRKRAGKLYFPIRTGRPGERKVNGHQILPEPDEFKKYLAYSTWTLSLPAGEDVLSLVHVPKRPVASLGRVLGNRTTLYKYLSPRLTAVVSGSARPPSCAIYVVDAAKGTVVYHARLPPAPGTEPCDVKVALAENWLVYHYYDGSAVGVDSAKGHRIVSVELYEGDGTVDKKIKSSDLSAFSNDTLAVYAMEQSFVYAHDVFSIAITGTQFGISSKELVVANKNGQIQTIPRRFLDPRRPKRKPTAEEQEEGLIPYDPLIPDDTKRIISHRYEVAQVKSISTSPALLESSVIIFAHGLDLFCGRTAPSGTFDVLSPTFNKAQLVLTIAGLATAIIAARPMARKKILRQRWYE